MYLNNTKTTPDFSGIRDVFFGILPDKKKIISNGFFEISSKIPSLSIDEKNVNFFISHGYFLPGKTFFKEISRVKVGNKLFFNDNGDFTEKSIWKNNEELPKINYKLFKKTLLSVFDYNKINGGDAILLSGGCDSGLLAVISVLEFSRKPVFITLKYKEPLLLNKKDVAIAGKLADFLRADHLIPELDFNNQTLFMLNDYVERMPLAAHLSLGFLKMAETAKEKNIKRIWSGQNADSLYNLGPGGNGKRNILRRFYLSKNYLKSLCDIKGNGLISPLFRAGGEIGNIAFQIKTKQKTRQPKNFQELLEAFENSQEYICLVKKDYNREKKVLLNNISSLNAKKIIFERKMQSFILGGDPRAIYSSADIFKIKAVLPYSAENMIHFFRRLEMNLADIVKPKRFIYRYLKELLGSKNFKRIYSFKIKNYKKRIRSENWEKKILENTKFGQELQRVVKNANLPSFLKYDPANLYNLISVYWFITILKKYKEQL